METNQCKDPMDKNKDCRVGQLTSISVTKDTLHYIEHVLALVPRHQEWVGRLLRWVGIKPLKKWRLRRLNIVEHVVIDTFGGSIWSELMTKGL